MRAPVIGDANRAVFEKPTIAAEYDPAEIPKLFPTERVILQRYRTDYVNRDVLDLGIGAGRTTGFIAPHAASYLGLDYSAAAIEFARQRYPQWQFRVGDARAMPDLADESFDFIIFSFNGIDYVDHNDRMRILREVARLLKRGGLFVFSSHNLAQLTGQRSFIVRRLATVRELRPFSTPLQAVGALSVIAVSLYNHLRNVRKERRGSDYALVNDPLHNFSIITYYVDSDEQRRQLAMAGFSDPIIQDDAGERVQSGSTSGHLHYIARKP